MLSMDQMIESIQPGTILIIGEYHGQKTIHDQQMSILYALRSKGFKVSVGLEFLNYTDQDLIQQYRSGLLSEVDFKSAVKWAGFDFGLYSPQLLFPQSADGEFGLGLNMPRSVTQTVSKNGLTSLTQDQLNLMPPQFTLGRDTYRERFINLMSDGHIPANKLENYFAAQSIWDDTMAWQIVEFVKNHQDHVFVVIVGEFHVQYGGGLPDRIAGRLLNLSQSDIRLTNVKIKTISQVWTQDLNQDEIRKELQPSEKYGPRADFISLISP